MAQQVVNIGVSANDGSGDPLRTAFDKLNDNDTELYADVAALQAATLTADSIMRTALVETCNGAPAEVHVFSAQFVGTYALAILDYEGIGIEVTAQDLDGFTTTSLSAGNFGYIALIEV